MYRLRPATELLTDRAGRYMNSRQTMPLLCQAWLGLSCLRPSASAQADLFLVLGTSLKVQPVSRILQFIPPHVPQVQTKADFSSGASFQTVGFKS